LKLFVDQARIPATALTASAAKVPSATRAQGAARMPPMVGTATSAKTSATRM